MEASIAALVEAERLAAEAITKENKLAEARQPPQVFYKIPHNLNTQAMILAYSKGLLMPETCARQAVIACKML
jgi:hypothetical protein